MERHRELAAGYAPKPPHEVSEALEKLLNEARRGVPGYAAPDRHRHTLQDDAPVIPARQMRETTVREHSGGNTLPAPSELDTAPYGLEPLEEHEQFKDIYEQFAPDEAEIALDAKVRELTQRLVGDISAREASKLNDCLAASKREHDQIRSERMRHLGDSMMPLLERRQAQLATVSADLRDYGFRPDQEHAASDGQDWKPAEVALEDIVAASTFKHWGGETISGQAMTRPDGQKIASDELIREMARDIALGIDVADEPDIFLEPKTTSDGRNAFVTQAGEYRVAALKLLGRTEVQAEIRQPAQ